MAYFSFHFVFALQSHIVQSDDFPAVADFCARHSLDHQNLAGLGSVEAKTTDALLLVAASMEARDSSVLPGRIENTRLRGLTIPRNFLRLRLTVDNETAHSMWATCSAPTSICYVSFLVCLYDANVAVTGSIALSLPQLTKSPQNTTVACRILTL